MGARPTDSLVLTNFNQTFQIKDETYQFRLVPVFQVCELFSSWSGVLLLLHEWCYMPQLKIFRYL
jgi:hypothetical protein